MEKTPRTGAKNNVVCITYQSAASADFEERFINLDKQIIQIDVESGSRASKTSVVKMKILKILAVGYFWLCLAAGALLMLIITVAFFNEHVYLRKISLDGKFLAQLSGGIYDRRLAWVKLDPTHPSGIYVSKKSSREKWLVAQQDNPGKYLSPELIDVRWEPDDSLVIED